MYIVFAIDIVCALLLLWAFYTVWKERLHFFSLRPVLPALALLLAGRVCDMLVEHPSLRLKNLFGLTSQSFEVLFGIVGNVVDVIGVSLLILGFIKIIKHGHEEERHIKDLETLLPLCSNCKRYRTDDNEWMPIEKYLMENGAPQLTHGICPDCAKKLYGDYLNK
jgi:hypothetical protein